MKLKPRDIVRLNKRRLKKYHSPFNPLVGDTDDPARFLLKVRGLRKVMLPLSMKRFPLVRKLVKAKSLSAFFRTTFFLDNFSSPAEFFASFVRLREKHDFPFWAGRNFKKAVRLNSHRFLLRELNRAFASRNPPRIVISKPEGTDLSRIICLLIAWRQSVGIDRLNAFHFAPGHKEMRKLKNNYLLLDRNSYNRAKRYRSLRHKPYLITFPEKRARLWFAPSAMPHNCRSLDFSLLYLSDISRWKGTRRVKGVTRASFPVIPYSSNSLIIMDGVPSSGRSFFTKELTAAQNNESAFTPISLQWHSVGKHCYSFDQHSERLEFAKRMLDNARRKTFPGYPNISGRKVFSLWRRGLPLEALYWYASRSRFYETPSQFNRLHPL